MPRLLRVFALLLTAALLVGCYHRERVTFFVVDAQSGQAIRDANIKIDYPRLLFKPWPSNTKHLTDAHGQANANVAEFSSVLVRVERPGYKAERYYLSRFTQNQRHLAGDYIPTLKVIDDDGQLKARPQLTPTSIWGMLITIPKGFRGPFVIEYIQAPLPSDESQWTLCEDVEITSQRLIRVPARRYRDVRVHYPGKPYFIDQNSGSDNITARRVPAFVTTQYSLWVIGTEKDAERLENQFTNEQPDGRRITDPDAYHALVEKVINQPL